MSMKFEVIGRGKVITVIVKIDDQFIKFYGVDKEVYYKRADTYRSPSHRYQLVRWLRKHSSHNEELDKDKEPVVKKTAPKKTTKQVEPTTRAITKAAPRSTPPRIPHGDMVLEVERQLTDKGYTVAKQGLTTRITKCEFTIIENGEVKMVGCGRQSVIGGYKDIPEPKFVGVCFHRYNPNNKCDIVKVWGKKEALAWRTKQKAA